MVDRSNYTYASSRLTRIAEALIEHQERRFWSPGRSTGYPETTVKCYCIQLFSKFPRTQDRQRLQQVARGAGLNRHLDRIVLGGHSRTLTQKQPLTKRTLCSQALVSTSYSPRASSNIMYTICLKVTLFLFSRNPGINS